MEQTYDEQVAELKKGLQHKVDHPGNYWIPNGAQLNFVKLIGGAKNWEENENTWVESTEQDNFINVFVAANGVGKTDALAHITGQLLKIIDNPYFRYQNHPTLKGELYGFYRHPPAGGRGRIVSTPTNLTDVIVPKLIEVFGSAPYKKEKRGKDYYSYFEGPTGRSVTLMSYEQDVDKFAGATLGWCFFDEPEDDPARFLETTARFRKGGKIFFTICPLTYGAWVHDLVIGNTNWDVGVVTARIWANSTDPAKGIRGILKPENINRMIAGWPPGEYEARALGQFMHLRGVVYPQFDRKVHVVDPLEIPHDGTLYCAMDPHDSRPPFIGWFKATADGRVYMVKEWPGVTSQFVGRGVDRSERKTFYQDIDTDDRTIDDYAQIIKDIEREIGVPARRIMDGRFGNKTYPNSGRKVYDEYNHRGVTFGLAGVDPTLARGHEKVKVMLQHDLEGKNGRVIIPRLFISSECENTIRAFERYAFKPKRDLEDVGREIVQERYKDPMDVVRMIADAEYKYVDPEFTEKWHSAFIPESRGSRLEGLL
jgi:hypothetical protein